MSKSRARKLSEQFHKMPRNGKLGPQYKVSLGDQLGTIIEQRAEEHGNTLSEEMRQLLWIGLAALDAGFVPKPEIAREIVIVNRAYAGK